MDQMIFPDQANQTMEYWQRAVESELRESREYRAAGSLPATEPAPASETGSITPDSHSAALGQVDTTPETPPSSPSDPLGTTTFRVIRNCLCVPQEGVEMTVKSRRNKMQVFCSQCGVSLLLFELIPAPVVDPATST